MTPANVRAWSKDELLACEKETLGLYLSGHPIDRYSVELASFASCTLAELTLGRKRVAGLIMSVRTIKTRRGRMAVVTLDDKTARIEITVYREVFEQHVDQLVADQIVVIEGKSDIDDFTGDHSIEADKIMTIEQARNHLARALVLSVSESELGNGFIATLESLITTSNGRCPIAIEYFRPEGCARLRLGDKWKVNATDTLIDGLKRLLGKRQVVIEY